MRLSEAIRLGAMLRPQAFGSTVEFNLRGDIIGSCAIGAAMHAGYRFNQDDHRQFCETRVQACCDGGKVTVTGLIAHLNDTHRWTREQIADWIETIEAPDDRSRAPEASAALPESSCSPTRV